MVSASLEPAGTGSAAASTLRPYLAPEVGSQGWDKALSQQMVNLGKAGHQSPNSSSIRQAWVR
jgi:hypothetical protein